MDNEKGWITLFWTMIGLGILAVIFNSGKVESDLTERVNEALHNNGYDWASVKEGSGRNLVLVGRAPVMAAREPAIEAAREVYGVRCVDDEISISEPASPYRWSASADMSRITLSGHVPDEATRVLINQKAGEIAVNRQVKDDMVLADGAPDEGWLENIAFALDQVRSLKNGSVKLVDQAVSIEGTSWNNDDAKALNALKEAPAGYSLSRTIKSPAMLAAESAPVEEETKTAEKAEGGDKSGAAEAVKAGEDKAPADAAKGTKDTKAAAGEDAAPAAAPATAVSEGKAAGQADDAPPGDAKTASAPAKADDEAMAGMKESAGKEAVTDTVSAKSGDESAAAPEASKSDKPGLFSKALSAIKSLGGKNEADNAEGAGDPARVNSGAKSDATVTPATGEAGDAAPAPGQAARSDGTENGAASPDAKQQSASNGGSADAVNGGPATPAGSDSAAASAKPVSGVPEAATEPADKAAPAAGAKDPDGKAAMAEAPAKVQQPAGQEAAGGQPAYPVPPVMLGPSWGAPRPGPWGPPAYYGPGYYYPTPSCPWGPASCRPLW